MAMADRYNTVGHIYPHIYPHISLPHENPAQQRAWTKVSPALLDGPPRFAGYRGAIDGTALDAYNRSDLGNVVWPQYPVMYNLNETIDELVRRPWLWLSDISNYVPGDTNVCHPTPPIGVCEYHAPRATVELLQQKLGDRFTGMDNGEQDGRYMAYAPMQLRGHGGSANARGDELTASYLQVT